MLAKWWEVLLRLGVARQQQFSSVSSRSVHVNHLHGGKLIEHGTRRKPRRQRFQSATESGMQAVGEKGDENVRLDARLEFVIDGADERDRL